MTITVIKLPTHPLVPVLGFLGLGILDHLGWQEVPVLLHAAALHLLAVDEHLVGVVGVQHQSVEVGVDVVLAADLLVDQMVLALVAKDDVHLLGSRAADIRTEHNFIGALAVHILLVQLAVEDLQVATTAVDVLLVLNGELDDDRLALVAEGFELLRQGVETGIFAGLQSLVLLGIVKEFASSPHELAKLLARVLAVDPGVLP